MGIEKKLEMDLSTIDKVLKTGAEAVEMFPERVQEYPISRGESIHVYLRFLKDMRPQEWVVYRDETDHFFFSTDGGKRVSAYSLSEAASGCEWKEKEGVRILDLELLKTIVLSTSMFSRQSMTNRSIHLS